MGVQVISYNMLRNLDSKKKIEKILDVVLKGDIAVVEGRLSPDEELSLTAKAMQNVSGKFPGIEIAFLDSDGAKSFIEKLKYNL
ncbi:DUF2073 domain-containing protein, partial [bacterium]|nr:DUF2073 domain-containing protein [bacterium]